MNHKNNPLENNSNETFNEYVKLLKSGGLLLMVATILALIWANSPFSHSYEELWHHTKFILGFENFQIEKHLTHWINDGLMAIFFFVVGIEIKREIVAGELNSLKKAALPLFGALGGMVVPIILFLMFNISGEASKGWGIPMATDIAFSIAVLGLLGKRVPIGLKVFLMALAIVDDLGAVLVIAFFYTSSIHTVYLSVALILIGFLFLINKLGNKNLWFYTGVGFVIWVLFLNSGVHATIAGVLVAFTIPVYPKLDMKEFVPKIRKKLILFEHEEQSHKYILTDNQLDAVDNIEQYARKVQSPLQSIEHSLTGLVNYIILPLFALANAGVALFFISETGEKEFAFTYLSTAIAVSLVLGKAIGISLFTWLAIKLKLADKPEDASINSIIGLSFIGGIGFTMSLFIGTLAFTSIDILNEAKTGIFVGSSVAGLIGYLILRYTLKKG